MMLAKTEWVMNSTLKTSQTGRHRQIILKGDKLKYSRLQFVETFKKQIPGQRFPNSMQNGMNKAISELYILS